MGVISGTGIVEAVTSQGSRSKFGVVSATVGNVLAEPWGKRASSELFVAAALTATGLMLLGSLLALGGAMLGVAVMLTAVAARRAAVGFFGEDTDATVFALATSVLWGLTSAVAVLRTVAVALLPVAVVLLVVWGMR